MRREIRIAGFGGQGIGLAGYILGKAAALYDGLEAVMTQSYGPEARGGASSANVVISDREIAYPFVQRPDILIALSQEAYNKYAPATKNEGLIIIDGDLVLVDVDRYHLGIPALRLAEEVGRRLVANMIILGFLTANTDLVRRKAMEQAIESSVKPQTKQLNLQAFECGFLYSVQGISTR